MGLLKMLDPSFRWDDRRTSVLRYCSQLVVSLRKRMLEPRFHGDEKDKEWMMKLMKVRLLRFARNDMGGAGNDKDKDAETGVTKVLDPRFHGDDKGTGTGTGEWCQAGRDPASRESRTEIASLRSQ